MRRIVLATIFVALASAPLHAEQRPDAVEILANQLAAVLAQGARMAEQIGKLTDENAQLKKQIAVAEKKPGKGESDKPK